MPSEYDALWQQRGEEPTQLPCEAYANDWSELAVPELRAVANRQRWAASVFAPAGNVLAAQEAQGKSLGHVLACLSQRYPDPSSTYGLRKT